MSSNGNNPQRRLTSATGEVIRLHPKTKADRDGGMFVSNEDILSSTKVQDDLIKIAKYLTREHDEKEKVVG